MKKTAGVLCIILLLGLILGACGQQNDNPVFAKVGNREIRQNDFAEVLDYYTQMYQIDVTDPGTKETVSNFATEVLNALVMSDVIAQKGEDEGIAKGLSKEEKEAIEKAVKEQMDEAEKTVSAELKEDYPKLSEAELEHKLKLELEQRGYEEDLFRRTQTDQVVWEKMFEKYTKDVKVSDDEIKKTYDDLVAEDKDAYADSPAGVEESLMYQQAVYYMPKGMIRVKHILITFDEETSQKIQTLYSDGDEDGAKKLIKEELVKLKTTAEKVQGKLKDDGSNFDELMETESGDPGLATNPNGYVVSNTKDSLYDQKFIKAAFGLKKEGDITGLVETDNGYHIIRLEELYPEGAVKFESVKEELAETALEEKKNNTFNKLADEWRKEIDVKTYDDRVTEFIDSFYKSVEEEAAASPEASE